MIELVVNGRLPSSVTKRDLSRAIRETFRASRRKERGNVGIAFLSNARMRKLNARYRQCDRPTDVLSFAAEERWGDILLAPTYIRASASERKIAEREELLRVTIHGLLHLFGYDHATRREEKRMFGIQERALAHSV